MSFRLDNDNIEYFFILGKRKQSKDQIRVCNEYYHNGLTSRLKALLRRTKW